MLPCASVVSCRPVSGFASWSWLDNSCWDNLGISLSFSSWLPWPYLSGDGRSLCVCVCVWWREREKGEERRQKESRKACNASAETHSETWHSVASAIYWPSQVTKANLDSEIHSAKWIPSLEKERSCKNPTALCLAHGYLLRKQRQLTQGWRIGLHLWRWGEVSILIHC